LIQIDLSNDPTGRMGYTDNGYFGLRKFPIQSKMTKKVNNSNFQN